MPSSAPASLPRAQPAAGRSAFQRLRYLTLCLVGGALLGLMSGWIWWRISSPPRVRVTSAGAVFGETELDQQVGVTFWFLIVAVTVGVWLGFFCSWRRSRHGLAVVAAVALSTVTAAAVCYWTGVHVFGPDASAQLATAPVGDQITAPLDLGTRIVFLGWPVGGLVGALVAIWWWPQPSATIASAQSDWTSSSPDAPAPDALR